MRRHRYEWSGSWGRIARRDPALLWAIEIVERDWSHPEDGQDQSDCRAGEGDCAAEHGRSEDGRAGRRRGARRRWRPRFWLFCPGFWLVGLFVFASVSVFGVPSGGW